MNHVPAHRLTFSSPAAQRIREAERRAVERMAAPAPQAGPPAADSIIPPPSAGPMYEGCPDRVEPAAPRYASTGAIQRAVCAEFGVEMRDLLSHGRNRRIARARQVGMYLVNTLTPLSLSQTGRRFGGRDHTTVLHAVRKIGTLLNQDPDFAAKVSNVRAQFWGWG